MKTKTRRACTVLDIELRPHWLSGYVGAINGKRVTFTRNGSGWRARHWGTIATAKSLRGCVAAVKAQT